MLLKGQLTTGLDARQCIQMRYWFRTETRTMHFVCTTNTYIYIHGWNGMKWHGGSRTHTCTRVIYAALLRCMYVRTRSQFKHSPIRSTGLHINTWLCNKLDKVAIAFNWCRLDPLEHIKETFHSPHARWWTVKDPPVQSGVMFVQQQQCCWN